MTSQLIAGSACKTTSGAAGTCVDDSAWNSSQQYASCVANTALTYSWKNVVIADCNCPSQEVLDANLCMNSSGAVVASNFCDGIDKPLPLCSCTDQPTDPTGGADDGEKPDPNKDPNAALGFGWNIVVVVLGVVLVVVVM